jgi:hypothetical protein
MFFKKTTNRNDDENDFIVCNDIDILSKFNPLSDDANDSQRDLL